MLTSWMTSSVALLQRTLPHPPIWKVSANDVRGKKRGQQQQQSESAPAAFAGLGSGGGGTTTADPFGYNGLVSEGESSSSEDDSFDLDVLSGIKAAPNQKGSSGAAADSNSIANPMRQHLPPGLARKPSAVSEIDRDALL